MKPFSRILISLDLSEMDFVLLRFICQFIRINQYIKDIYFIHVVEDLEKVTVKNEGLLKGKIPNDELFKIRMREEVGSCLDLKKNLNVHFEIVEGDPLKQLLHWSKIKYVDLIIAGKKTSAHGRGVVLEKLARKTDCSILFVPQNYKPRFRKILIPIDFTSRTDNVFEAALMISSNLPHTQFICQHVVEVPSGYTRIGKTFEEFSEIMKGHAVDKWEEYNEKHNLDDLHLKPVFIINENGSIAKSIINYAHEEKVDLIMMGSKRQTNASVFFLGSVGEELITRDKDILLLLVKYQKEPYDFFKAMKKI